MCVLLFVSVQINAAECSEFRECCRQRCLRSCLFSKWHRCALPLCAAGGDAGGRVIFSKWHRCALPLCAAGSSARDHVLYRLTILHCPCMLQAAMLEAAKEEESRVSAMASVTKAPASGGTGLLAKLRGK